jgi:hypothetical protein
LGDGPIWCWLQPNCRKHRLSEANKLKFSKESSLGPIK